MIIINLNKGFIKVESEEEREALLDMLRPHGEWVFDGVYRDENNPIDNDMYHCNLCKRSIMTSTSRPAELFPFCHCGADMRGTKHDS